MAIKQKQELTEELKNFYKSEAIKDLISSIEDSLVIIQSQDMELDEATRQLVNLSFTCYLPEMQEEIIRKAKAKASKAPAHESRRAQIERILSGQREPPKEAVNHQISIEPVRLEEEELRLQLEAQKSTVDSKKLSAVKTSQIKAKQSLGNTMIFKGYEEGASLRLVEFNNFCLRFKPLLNRIVKQIYGAEVSRER